VAFCRDHGIRLLSDVSFSEVSLTADHLPCSILQLPGAREIAVEILGLDRVLGRSGAGVGLCVGRATTVEELTERRQQGDEPVSFPLQNAAAAALTGDDTHLADRRRRLLRRRERLVQGLARLGWEVPRPSAGPHVFAPLPATWSGDAASFALQLYERAGVLVVPGEFFGRGGAGAVRLSLGLDEAGLDACLGVLEASGLLAAGAAGDEA